MLKQTVFLAGLFSFFLIAVFVFERTDSPLFQACIQEHQHDEGGATANDNQSGLGVTVSVYVRCTGRFANANGNGITALATIIIAAFTGTLWVATTRQAQLTREALNTDKRAFISAEGYAQFYIRDPESGLYNWTFRPEWRNGDSTPTKNATMHTACEIRNDRLPPKYPFSYQTNEVATAFISARGGLRGSLAPRTSPITAQDIVDAQMNRKFIYLWGWMKYSDVFAGTPEHITHFCWQLEITGDPKTYVPNTQGLPPTPGVLAFTYLQHPEGNCAD